MLVLMSPWPVAAFLRRVSCAALISMLQELCVNNFGNFDMRYYSGIIPQSLGIIENK